MTPKAPETHEVDVVVIGSGAAGLAAAVVAAQGGAKVLVVEKDKFYGGSTAISGGVVWIPCNPMMDSLGLSDSREDARRYLSQVLGNKMRGDLVDAFLEHGPEMVNYMHANTELRLVPRQIAPDYYPDLEGATLGGRAMDPQVYDGRRLGAWFAAIRWPIKEFLVFGGLMVGRKEIDHLLGTFKSPSNFMQTLRLVGQFARDRLTHGRGTRLLMGNSLVAQLFKTADDAGVEFWNLVTVTKLEKSGPRVTGVTLHKGERTIQVTARRGVVLAAGGSAANAEQIRQQLSAPGKHYTMAPSANTGDIQSLAVEIGARVDADVVDPVNYSPVSVMTDDSGNEIRFPHLFLDRPKPGLIAVNAHGRRFVDEATSYHAFVQGMYRDGSANPAFLVCDASFIRRYGLGLVRPGLMPYSKFIKSGYLHRGSTIADLAASISVPAHALEDEIKLHNQYAATGIDLAFGKGGNAYDRVQGDPANKPNPCLAPIEQPPYYAVAVYSGDIGSTRGLVTDGEGRVMGENNLPIAGLYACGNDMNSVMAGTYPAAGITLGPCLTFGYIIGKSLT